MKTIRFLKVIDVVGQLALTLWYIVLPFAFPNLFGRNGVYYIEDGLFVWLWWFGGWQVASWLLHWAAPREVIRVKQRRLYGFLLLPAPILMWTVILYPVPMAIFYFSICCVELFTWAREDVVATENHQTSFQ